MADIHYIELSEVGARENGDFFKFTSYLQNVWASRYLCWHLAKSDLRAKFRRSSLGIMWCIIHPLALTLLLSFIMSAFFQLPMQECRLYVFSGLIIWEFLSNALLTSCNALVNAEGYIKQSRRPLAIYSLRCVIVSFISLSFSLVAFLVWDIVSNFHLLNGSIFSMLLVIPFYLFFIWPLGIIVSFIATRFRDFSQLIIIGLQFCWYISPVFFQPKMFASVKLSWVVTYNPIFHLMNLVRAPSLYGVWPSLTSYVFIFCTAIFFWLVAILMLAKQEPKLIFYI